jgi:esterase/lipase superfamily enzyme
VGTPVLLFPTAGGDAEEVERFHLVDAVSRLLTDGRVKLYSLDSLPGRVMLEGRSSHERCSWLLNAWHESIYHEVVPRVLDDCRSRSLELVAAGASIGAFNACAVVCRYPDAFRSALCLSGTFDLVPMLPMGLYTRDFYFASPLHFVPHLDDGPQLACLRRRSLVFAFGQGRWEDPAQSWRMAGVLGARGVPNRVDRWGPEWDHDWVTWRAMLPTYLEEIA